MSKRIVLVTAAVAVAVGLAVQSASAASSRPAAAKASTVAKKGHGEKKHATKKKHAAKKHHAAKKKHAAKKTVKLKKVKRTTPLIVGINDEPDTLYGDPASAFKALKQLRTQVLRVNLYWGGNQWAVANTKPADPTDPGDPAYNWAIYDRLVQYAHTYGIQVVFSILFTPGWANGGQPRTHAPKRPKDLQNFAYAAAERYSGFWTPPAWQAQPELGIGDEPLPAVTMWTAWNEPNNPIWLAPQYKRVGGRWRVESAFQYAKICNAVYRGVHSVIVSPQHGPVAGEQVACGVTGPKGNDAPKTKRPSVDPLTFLTAAHRYGMKKFDVYAHHPYASSGKESPTFVPSGKNKRRIQMGNLDVLMTLLTKYYGSKMHLWITEYGIETNPPDKTILGTSWRNQARWMKQAWTIAHNNPRIDMFLWFLVKDEAKLGGWQSGLETLAGRHKPAWNTFRKLPRSPIPTIPSTGS